MNDVARMATQRLIQEWFDKEIRPHTDAHGTFLKFLQEVNELTEELAEHPEQSVDLKFSFETRMEVADVFISFIAWVHAAGLPLDSDVMAKMLVNQGRTWGPPDENGVISHVDSTYDMPFPYSASGAPEGGN